MKSLNHFLVTLRRTTLLALVVIGSWSIISCQSDADRLQDSLARYASDNEITEAEYHTLLNLIKETGLNGRFNENGEPDHDKIKNYLILLSKKTKVELTEADIFSPSLPLSNEKFNVNVFLENSASMNGYVGINSSFKTTVFKFFTDLRNFSSVDTLSLNYINSRAITVKENASRDDIEDFYRRLNPADFRRAGGNVASTDIERMLKLLLDLVDDRTLNVFISDCVFSPGKTNAKKYLDGQYAAIYNDFTHARQRQGNLSVVLIQLSSKFEGTYFDYLDSPHFNMDMERPYYIWLIGAEDKLKQLAAYGIYDLIKGGYKNRFVLQSNQFPTQPEYKILQSNKIGTFRLKEGSKGPLSDAEPSEQDRTKGFFGFSVAADYSKSLQDLNYFTDTSNYRINSNYHLRVENIAGNKDVSLDGFTHKLKLETKELRNEEVKIEVLGKVPNWVYNSNSMDDSRIEVAGDQKSKTFGLKYLIEGVTDAFYPESKSNTISTLTISIKK